ncbi:MAG: metallophosphoesterase family protein [Acidobacteriaceae bacterium]|nr:metallophosphoesterase family protein [Acidobacteriaceae bacterium]
MTGGRLIGIISDTHGLLRPEALHALRPSELIIHAGDVGSADVLERLEQIAPVVAVRGNVDIAAWADKLPMTAAIEAGEGRIWVLHDLGKLDIDPIRGGFRTVIYGHSHKPAQGIKEGVLYLNPGSAGPRRFHLPVSVIHADFGAHPPSIRFLDLSTGKEFVP